MVNFKNSFLATLILVLCSSITAAQPVSVPEDYMPPFRPEDRPLEGLVITVDPGHGGSSYAPGYHGSARGTNSRIVEEHINMTVSALVYHHLQRGGAEVHLTRRDDRKVVAGDSGRAEELGARPALAEATRSHLFLSIHHNSAARKTADGVVVLIWPTDSKGNDQLLERAFAEALRTEVESRVQHNEPFGHYINNHPLSADSDIPSAVLEAGFLSNAEFDAWMDRPTAAKEEAIGIYHGVVKMWTEHRDELEALRDELMPLEEKKEATSRPASRPSRAAATIDSVINEITRSMWTDKTTFVIKSDKETGSIRTNHHMVSERLTRMVQQSSDENRQVELLPSQRVMDEPFGVVTVPMALTWGEPEEGKAVQTQLLHGEPLFLLDQTEDEQYYLVQGIDGYVGWVRWDAVHRLSQEEFTELMIAEPIRTKTHLMDDTFPIPVGSLLFEKDGKVHRWNQRSDTMMSPLEVSREDISVSGHHALGRAIAETGLREFLYFPYVFGGRSDQGLDCSGFVGACYAAHGIQLPRDANQQALVGRIVGTYYYRDAILPGDVLFFSDANGKTFHTGIALGDGYFIHASTPEVQINSFDPEDGLYSEFWDERFILARRPAG